MRVGEVADRNGDVFRKAFALPVDGGAARRTEMKGQRVATFGCPHPSRRLTGEGDLLAAEARLVADRGASAALALQAVAHGDARRFALNHKMKLPATAGGASGGHGLAPWRTAKCRLDFEMMHHGRPNPTTQLMSASGPESRHRVTRLACPLSAGADVASCWVRPASATHLGMIHLPWKTPDGCPNTTPARSFTD